MKYHVKVDKNQPEIVKELRKKGCAVLHTHQLKNAFDILVGYRKKLYLVEIKTDHSKKLTSGEQKCKELFATVGVDYLVITTADEFFNNITDGRE